MTQVAGNIEEIRLKTTVTVRCGSRTDIGNVPLVSVQSAGLSRSGSIHGARGLVPVVDDHNRPLLPCRPGVARRLVGKNKAVPYYRKGFFVIRLRKVVGNISEKSIVMSIDPGSKRTGITVATEDAVILNVQCDTPDRIKKKMESRRNYRRSRRTRNAPYRKCRFNRKIGGVPPSTKARWSVHLRILDTLRKIIPITNVVIEDIAAKTMKNGRKWNVNFSPLEVGKKFFAEEVAKRRLTLDTYAGYETKKQRTYRGFSKSHSKLAENWNVHCVDSHCLAEILFGNIEPVPSMYVLDLLQFHRRELHQGFKKGGVRQQYGSTRSLGLCRGTIATVPKYGLVYVGGTSKGRISVHSVETGKRLTQNVNPDTIRILTKLTWRRRFLPGLKAEVSAPSN